MSKLTGESLAYKAADKGVKLGETKPSRETKGSWYEVYYYEEKIIAVIFFDLQNCYIADGEFIEKEELAQYTEDTEKAFSILESLIQPK